ERARRVEHSSVHAVAVHQLDSLVGVVCTRMLQVPGDLSELVGCGGHVLDHALEIVRASPSLDASHVPCPLLGIEAWNEVAPSPSVHAACPQITWLHHVPVSVDNADAVARAHLTLHGVGSGHISTPGRRSPLSAPRAHRRSSLVLVTVVTPPVTARGAAPPAQLRPTRVGGGREG